MKKALITGITGQDGAYMAQLRFSAHTYASFVGQANQYIN